MNKTARSKVIVLNWCLTSVAKSADPNSSFDKEANLPISDRMHKVFETAKKLADKRRAREQQPRLLPPHGSPEMVTPPDTEQLLQLEQLELAGIIDDAIAILSAPSTQAAKTALRERAGKLSLSARITARVLTKVRLDTKTAKGA
jgi:hypothetical protein